MQGNDAPDVALFPQPGIMVEMADQGLLADLSDVVDECELEQHVQGVLETGQVDGTQYAVPMSINVKSIVFYPKQAFEAAGYEVPETYDDLVALTDQIQETGTTPWCFGIESEAATGWPATDWVENLYVINNGADAYKEWVDHEVPFNDDTVAEDARADGGAAARRGPYQRWPSVDRQQQLQRRGQPPCSTSRRAASCTGRATSSRSRSVPGRRAGRPRQHCRRLPDAGSDGRRQAGPRRR